MRTSRTYLSLVTATVMLTLFWWAAAQARGGGSGRSGGIAHISGPSTHFATPYSPGISSRLRYGSSPVLGNLPVSPLGRAPSPAVGGAPSPAFSAGVRVERGRAARSQPDTTGTITSLTGSTAIVPPPAPDVTTIPSQIALPMQEPPPIAPLAPQLQTQFSSGGSLQSNLALSPGTTAQGGGGETLADCMGFWDPETHMSKVEWKATCLRTMKGYISP